MTTPEGRSVGEMGSVAGLWAIKCEMESLSAPPGDLQYRRGRAGRATVDAHLSPGVLSSRYVPDFASSRLRAGFEEGGGGGGSTSDWTCTSGEWTHGRTGVRIRQCSASSSEVPREEHTSLRKAMEFVLEFMWYMANDGNSETTSSFAFPREIVVVTLACDVPRGFPEQKGAALGPVNVNGGVCTYTDAAVRHVLVYRSQHMHKVLMHELIHACDVGAALSASPSVTRAERDVMRRLGYASASGGLEAHEAYTEVLACYAHVFRRVMWEALARKDREENTTEEWLQGELYALWDAERRLYFGVCRAIVDHFRPGSMREETHVMSYFFAKAALWDAGLDDTPAVITNEREAERFAHVFRERLLSDDFWAKIRDVPADEIASAPLMTRAV